MSEQISFKDIRKGDEEAFEKLFRQYYKQLYRFVWGYVESRAVAEELVQDVFLTIWEEREDITIERSLKSYLFGAARNKSIDWLRHQKVEKAWRKEEKKRKQAQERPGLNRQLHNRQMLREVKRTIRDLPQRQREVFMLSRYEQMTYREIAKTLEISESTVETHMSRALESLRNKFMPLLTLAGGVLLVPPVF
ncbi:RNA polymerase sigma-70 factor, ECF subfamily [Fodinibius roseus]|uniref:RNA polymerase sigma-70 factor, ECF subfamily n=1 Tax=Fodinibius roseus TaxID=1194090 RepID=A0A1M5AIQ5_9BACT|nr:RNA polymerase sigma-70 factor [Fodinibius roseus]SHF30161.1 RNA polymerase sigma-70 factor, ECF subfamily [Fodinibius roseus]